MKNFANTLKKLVPLFVPMFYNLLISKSKNRQNKNWITIGNPVVTFSSPCLIYRGVRTWLQGF